MTAIVGILNKRAIALAADSAVTIDGPNGHKVLNSANKIYSISRSQPVGVMLYASASFMETPWELIIKLYRDQIGHQSFSTLRKYVENFVDYLKRHNFFCSKEMQHKYLLRHLHFYYQDVLNIAVEECKAQTHQNEIPFAVVHQQALNVLAEHQDRFSKQEKCPDFEKYKLTAFLKSAKGEIDEVEKMFAQHVVDKSIFRKAFEESFFYYLCSEHICFDKTGLVFAGYGEEDIYPSIIPLNASFAFDGKLRAKIDLANAQQISEDNKSAICPFAQTDVMFTILTGIDNSIKNFAVKTHNDVVNQLMHNVINISKSKGAPQEVINGLQAIDVSSMVGFFQNSLENFIRTEHITKLVGTVEYLGNEDMANMAESLVALTGLQRRMTSTEETVGGPVDVALISKSDGFIWMKRKHYFERNLNEQFYTRYK